ncbi:MAG TPA: peptide-methionine (S)-S-oxide reductase MsrA [Abditibacteriaceae bacterium]
MRNKNGLRLALLGVFGIALALGLNGILAAGARTTESNATAAQASDAKVKPKTHVAVPKDREVATFAGGCFWSMEAMFGQLKGVDRAEPGYAGGHLDDPKYEQVGAGDTGHAEAIEIIYDPKQISYRDLLEVFFAVHDPTTLNRQGADVGTNYRSAVFYHTDAQRAATAEAIRDITKKDEWGAPIVTEVTPFSNFYRAEEYHQDYYNRHPDEPYNRSVVAPKIVKFREKFAAKLKP